jgi:hypothetical protein
MRRFALWAPTAAPVEVAVWLDTGFAEYKPDQTGDEAGLRPDVMFWRPEAGGERCCREALRLLPKAVVIAGDGPAVWPESLSEFFTPYYWRRDDGYYVVGSSLEQQLTEPVWEAYGEGLQLDAGLRLKAVSDRIYRYLLADLFSETREWCGHTFSVVNHM